MSKKPGYHPETFEIRDINDPQDSVTNTDDILSELTGVQSEYGGTTPLPLEGKEDLQQTNSVIFRTKSTRNEPDITNQVPYSRFGKGEKWFLVALLSCTGFFSTIAGNIYYPVLTVIEKKFNITEEQVNMTVVVYFLLQGISPSVLGGFADSIGSRPMVIICALAYCAACIGLACSQKYVEILILRIIQSAGISPINAINSGIMGDVTIKSERGGYVGYVTGFQTVGAAFGALFGALLAARWGWRAIFWFLAIGSGTCSLFSVLLLPETKRTIVGNGSIRPKTIQNIAPVLSLPFVQRRLHLNDPDLETLEPRAKVSLTSSFSVLKIPEVDILLVIAALQYALWATQQTALSIALSKKYHYDVLRIGLCYLPAGIGTLLSVIFSGKYLNYSYKKMFEAYSRWIKEQESKLMEEYDNDKRKVREVILNDPKYTFNLCEARLRPAFLTLVVSSSFFCGLGWCLEEMTSIVAVLFCSGIGCLFSSCMSTFSSTLLVDLFPSKPTAAASCLYLVRCCLAGVYVACLSRMIKAMNYGGLFTLLGGLSVSSCVLLVYLIHRGKILSFKRKKEEQKILTGAGAALKGETHV